ncbi:FAD-binding oxidoreductase [Dactylosporangium sp. CA-152071]|uniref:FAD-binding oxidoreductase n=1 Tax=Dactylosporangium sp. CA-152071 TaxID=3239933 RepID=UPI003D94B749
MPKLTALRTAVEGRVLLPCDDGFDAARRPWNLAVDQPAAAVVEAAHAADVAAVVRFAAAEGLAVAPQPTGHGATGNTGDAILLRTGRLDQVHVDAAARTARVGAGATWGAVQAAAGPRGLTGLAGSSPVVGVTGYTLGGGMSWFGRAFGWAADSVTAFDVVDAAGVPAKVTADSDAELFWALRGGGGDVAVVTAVEFRLHPAPVLYGGRMLWPADRAPRVLAAFRDVAWEAPRELTLWFELMRFPGGPPLVAVDVTYLGDAATGAALTKPFADAGPPMSDSRAVLPVADLGSITAEPVDPSPGLSFSALLHDLDGVAGALLDRPVDPLLAIQVRQLGGAFAGPSDSPFGPLTEPYSLYTLGIPATPERAAAIRERQREIVAALGPAVAGRKPLTALSGGESVGDAFVPGVLARLREVKRRRDPAGVLRSNYPVA